jgi:hypothetical protein
MFNVIIDAAKMDIYLSSCLTAMENGNSLSKEEPSAAIGILHHKFDALGGNLKEF